MPRHLQAFIKDILASERMQRKEVKVTVFADRFVPWLPAHISKARDGLEGLERHVLTEYLIGGNFFRVPDPKRVTDRLQRDGRGVPKSLHVRQPSYLQPRLIRRAVSSRIRD